MERTSSEEGLALLKRPLKFKRGDKGPFIVDIQEMFAKLGFDPGEPEGVFVAKTEDAVRVFQSEYGLPVTGIIDAQTLKLLYEEADPQGYPATLIEGQEIPLEDQDMPSEEQERHPEENKGPQDGGEEPATEHEASEDSRRGQIGPGRRQSIDDEESIANKQPRADRVPVVDEELMGDQGSIADEGSITDQGSIAGQRSIADEGFTTDQGQSVDVGLAADEQPVAGLTEARPAMATGASDDAIVISLSERALGLYQDNQLIRRYPVAIGKPSTPTPVGTHRILEKVLYPGGGLGTRWIGFTYQMHGIHGTNRPELIGQEVSNGCVRMHNPNVEELYEMVSVGTPVVVIVAPVQSWSGLGKPTSPIGGGSGQAGAGLGQAGKPGGILDPAGPQPKDPKDTSQTPGPVGSSTSGSGTGRTYTVQPGDSLWAIARRFGTTIDAIVSANKIRNPELIFPGEVLKIP